MYEGCAAVSCNALCKACVCATASYKASYKAYMCVLQPLVRPHVMHASLGLHIAVILKGITTRIWSFGCGFACATAMGCAGFRLLFGTAIVL